jgi:hypoxanthine phosphoribosyltransferase
MSLSARAEFAQTLLAHAECIVPALQVRHAVERLASEISRDLQDDFPLVLSVMGGAVVFTGHLLPLLNFPLEFDVLKASRYGETTGGGEMQWSLKPKSSVQERVVLLLDDILDEGETLSLIRTVLLQDGASKVLTAVLTDKQHGRPKPIAADYIGLSLPDRYVFGCGMDAYGLWRNLPDIYALNPDAPSPPILTS